MYTKYPLLNLVLGIIHMSMLAVIVYGSRAELDDGQLIAACIVIGLLSVAFIGHNVIMMSEKKEETHRERSQELMAPGEIEQREAHERDAKAAKRTKIMAIIIVTVLTVVAAILYASGVNL